MSKFQDILKNLATESDSDKRLEIASSVDEQVSELDERYDNKELISAKDAEIERLSTENADLQKKYADRFFDKEEGVKPTTIVETHKKDIKEESKELGYKALWNNRKG